MHTVSGFADDNGLIYCSGEKMLSANLRFGSRGALSRLRKLLLMTS